MYRLKMAIGWHWPPPPLPLVTIGILLCFAGQFLPVAPAATYKPARSPVIFIHGILSSKLYIRGENVQYPEGKGLENCEKTFGWRKVWVSTENMLGIGKLNCAIHQMKLYYNTSNGQYENLPGIEVSVTKQGTRWGYDADPVTCLLSDDISIGWNGDHWWDGPHPVVKRVISFFACHLNEKLKIVSTDVYASKLFEYLANDLGWHQRLSVGDGIYVAAYDWRHNYNSEALKPYYDDLTKLVEDITARHERKVTFIAHSMGNLVLAHFLQMKDNAWLKKHIYVTINVAPPYGGTVLMMNVLKDAVNPMGIDNKILRHIQNFILDDKTVNYFFRSIPSTAVLLPRKNAFGRRELFRSLELRRNFGADEMAQFLQYLELPHLVKIYKATEEVKFPAELSIEMICIFSTSSVSRPNTPEIYVYTGSGETYQNKGPGDDRVNLASMREPCQKFREYRTGRGYGNVILDFITGDDHLGVLSNFKTLKTIGNALSRAGQHESPGKKMLKRMMESDMKLQMRTGIEKAVEMVEEKQNLPSVAELDSFFETLPEVRRQRNKRQSDGKPDPTQSQEWAIHEVYGGRGWNRPELIGAHDGETSIYSDDEVQIGLEPLLDIARDWANMGEGGGGELVRLEKPWELAVPAVYTEMKEEEENGNEKMDKKASMRTGPSGRDLLDQGFREMRKDLRMLGYSLSLFPLAILTTTKGARSSSMKKKEDEKAIKFLVLAAAETRTKTRGKSLGEIIKQCDHLLLEYSDASLVMDSLEILPQKIEPSQISNILNGMNLSAEFRMFPDNANWTGAIRADPVANLGKMVDQFMELVEREWNVKVKGEGGEKGTHEDFALVREELTSRKLGPKLDLPLDEGLLAFLRQKWQQTVAFIRFKNQIRPNMDRLERAIEDKMTDLLEVDDVRALPLATTGNDSALFLFLSSRMEGVLRVDNLYQLFGNQNNTWK